MVSVTLKISLATPKKVKAEAWHKSTTSLAGINPREMKTHVLGNVFGVFYCCCYFCFLQTMSSSGRKRTLMLQMSSWCLSKELSQGAVPDTEHILNQCQENINSLGSLGLFFLNTNTHFSHCRSTKYFVQKASKRKCRPLTTAQLLT